MPPSATLGCVLFVDDDPGILRALARLCRDEPWQVLTSCSPDNALAILEETLVGVVVSDHEMPGSTGTAFLTEVRRRFPSTARILLTGSADAGIAADAVNRAGVCSLLSKPWNDAEVRSSLRRALEERRPAAPHLEVRRVALETVRALAAAVDAKDPYTHGHSERVAIYSVRIAAELGAEPAMLRHVYLAALLHDIGKIGIPDGILGKPGRLTREEYAHMRRHPEIGARILEPLEFLREVAPCVRHHHEWYDGSSHGYPDRLKGAAIPYASRLILVADTVEAMSSDRPYRRSVSLDEVAREILRYRGSQFDPEAADAFLAAYEREGDEFLAAKFALDDVWGDAA